MKPHSLPDGSSQVAWEEGERVFYRGRRLSDDGDGIALLLVAPAADYPSRSTLDRLTHEYELRDELDGAGAVRPLELVRDEGRAMLVLEDPGGVPLDQLLGAPMELERFLPLSVGIAAALGKVHQRGLVHKDIKPTNILVNGKTGGVRLTGFGIASRLSRERQAAEPPETIAGTLAYMAPEQTGRMNRSIDSRSDLYSLGITLYQMLTGSLPFNASDPMEWIHCHIARQPASPAERIKGVPGALSAIIMKLVAKAAEERYQTAVGLEDDLRHCLADWERWGRIDDFPLGRHDIPDRLLIPEKLYGREREVATLLSTFRRIAEGSAPELVLVTGYSGIGKSSVVNELHKALVPPRALFAAGKFDQYKRDVPYATLAQALQGLVRSLLGKDESELGLWRAMLLEALEPNGRLMVDLVPELKLIIGEQPPVSELQPQDAKRRFHLVFRRLIGVFARAEHPLALFLDDLQWLDAATLDLLEDLLSQPDLRQLLLIAAYRSNEVTAAHPLIRKLEAIRSAGGRVTQITLEPLARGHLACLITDSLHCEAERAVPLAKLVHEKTGGNPFFSIQFLAALAEEGLLSFEHDAARWFWDLDSIDAKGYTDNVVDLMVAKLIRAPAETQKALQLLACLGNTAEISMLSVVLEMSEDQVHAVLWPAVRQDLIERRTGAYRFVHDRVQEAAYSTVADQIRALTHLRIGRLLVSNTPPQEPTEAIFDIVNQLNRGSALITSPDERVQLAELNLLAARRAKAASAHASALKYLIAGGAVLPEDSWEHQRKLAFTIEFDRAECEFLTGAPAEAERRLAGLSARAADTAEDSAVAFLRMDLYVTLGQSSRTIAVGLEYLRHRGIDWALHPTDEETRREYDRFWSQLGTRTIEDLVELPLMTDPERLATMDVIVKLGPAALHLDANLLALSNLRIANLSVEHGISDVSCVGFVTVGLVAGPQFGDYKAGYRFARLGYDLAERRGLLRFQARTYMIFGQQVLPWTEHVRVGRDLLRRALDGANRTGDLTYAAYCGTQLTTNLLAAGDQLVETQREAESALAFAQQFRFGLVIDRTAIQLALIRMLRGLTPTFGSLDDQTFNEFEMERRFADNPDLALAEYCYWLRKMQGRFVAGRHSAAVEAASRAQRLLRSSPSVPESADFHLFAALSRAACCEPGGPDPYAGHREALAAHDRQLREWAENCPANFENCAALVGAEIARIEGRNYDAMEFYEQAIRSARVNGFVHNEALASELAARFYVARNFEINSQAHLRNARHCYLRWGADGKVRQLDEIYPHLRTEEPAPAVTSTIGAPLEHLDLTTLINVLQAISGEIVLDKLLDTLMRNAIQHAGAERGLLILAGPSQRIAAEATTDDGKVRVHLRDEAIAEAVPESVFHYVVRTRNSIVLDDVAAHPAFAADPYIRQRQARSVLCLPLLNQAKLIGVLYLENNLAPRVFAPGRIAVLKLLASQAAISLENTRLYRDLAEREARIRRLVDANIIGIMLWDIEGRILEANDEYLRIVGYDREDLVSGRLRWRDLTPPEWLDRHEQRWMPELEIRGSVQPFEKEYFRKDGSRVPVLVGVARFEEAGNQGVSFVIDLTDRKRSEAAARDSERRYHAVQMELAHANRAATMGQLTASIAHEVNQPITAALSNAEAALLWLDRRPPDLEEARQALGRIVRDSARAGDVISRIRALIKKAPPRQDCVEINGAAREVIELTRGEAVKNGVSVRMALAEGLPLIHGDRVQLQQVILNLVINAIEAMSEGEGARDLRISTAPAEPGSVLVEVEDSGPGLKPAALESLFDAFYTTKPNGLGMGLSICQSIVEAHGGRLWVTANSPRGAIFHFTVPTQAGSEP